MSMFLRTVLCREAEARQFKIKLSYAYPQPLETTYKECPARAGNLAGEC